jgi:hypothetical protein
MAMGKNVVLPGGSGEMSKSIGGVAVRWQLRSWRDVASGILWIPFGGLAGLMVAGGLLNIDNTANAAHTNAVQDLIGGTAIVLGLLIAVFFISLGWSRLRRPMVSRTSSAIVVRHRRMIALPIEAVSTVGITARKDGARRRMPCLVLLNGSTIKIKGGRSFFGHRVPQFTAIEAAGSGLTGKRLGRPERIALRVRDHLSSGPHPSGSTLGTNPQVAGRIRHVDQLPSPPLACRCSREQRPPVARRSGWVIVIGLLGISLKVVGAQDGSGHPFDVAQFAAAMGAIVISLGLLFAVWYVSAIAEVAVGENWIAIRRHGHRRWRIAHAGDVVGVLTRSSAGGLRFNDADGRSLTLKPSRLSLGIGDAVLTAFADSDAMTPETRVVLGAPPLTTAGLESASMSPPHVVVAATTTAGGRETYRVRNSAFTGIVINGILFSAMAIGFLVGAAVSGFHNGGLVVVGVLMAIFAAMMWLLGWSGMRSVVLDPSGLKMPIGFKGTTKIPLGDVCGIGLAIVARAPKMGWALTVWTTEGVVVRSANVAARGTAMALLAESPAGRMTQDIWSRIAGSQGPNGALVVQEAQRHSNHHGNVVPAAAWDPSTGHVVDVNAQSSIVEEVDDRASERLTPSGP